MLDYKGSKILAILKYPKRLRLREILKFLNLRLLGGVKIQTTLSIK